MRVRSVSQIRVDLITTKTEVGEIAKASQALGYRMVLERADEGQLGASQAILTRQDEAWGSVDLAAQVLVHAIAGDRSPRQVLDGIVRDLEEWGANVDVVPGDAPPIGEGARGE